MYTNKVKMKTGSQNVLHHTGLLQDILEGRMKGSQQQVSKHYIWCHTLVKSINQSKEWLKIE